MRVDLSPAAEQDVRDIYEFGRRTFGENRADSYFADLCEAFDHIGENPKASRERNEVDPPARIYVFHAHLIFYRISSDRAVIVRILHGHVDWQSGLDS